MKMMAWRVCRRYSFRYRRYSSENSNSNLIPKSFLNPSPTKTSSQTKELIKNDMENWMEIQEKKREYIRKRAEEEGLEKFDQSLTSRLDRYAPPKALKSHGAEKWEALLELIEKRNAKLPKKEEHRYELKPKQEMIYKDVIYDNEIWSRVCSGVSERFVVDYRPLAPKYSSVRNITQNAHQSRQFAASIKPKYPKIAHRIETSIGNYTDEYHWLHNEANPSFQSMKESEELYTDLMQKNFEILKGTIQHDLDSYQVNPGFIPMPMGEYEYSRSPLGIEDYLTIYRARIGKEKDKEPIFLVDDIYDLYEKYGESNPEIKNFVERLKDNLEKGLNNPLIDFIVDKEDRYLAMTFSLEGPKFPNTVLIKDLKEGKIIPVVIHGTEGTMAFECDTHSLYFVEVDLYKRPHRVYRYSVRQNVKALIYEESDKDYSLSLEQSRNGEYIFIEIRSNYEPCTNEVWFKAAQGGTKFTLYNPMQYGVSYTLQQSGEYFYVMTNEGKSFHYLIKVKIPEELLYKHISHNKPLEGGKPFSLPAVPKNVVSEPLSLGELEKQQDPKEKKMVEIKNKQTPSKYFLSRNSNLEDYNKALASYVKQNTSLVTPPVLRKEVFYEEFKDEPVLDYSVFQHYLLAQTGELSNSRLLVKSLLKDTQHQIYLPDPPLAINIEVTRRYNINTAIFTTMHTNHPEIYHKYNMSLQKMESQPLLAYENLDASRYAEDKIMVKARDGVEVPVRLVYHKSHFNENSPAILYTNGGMTNISSLAFKPWLAAALERGCTIVYPEIRGSKTIDLQWYIKGTLTNKITHFTDFGDVGNYLKEQKIAKKIAAIGEYPSGTTTVATVMLKEPELFEAVALVNGVYDLADYMISLKENELFQECGDISFPEVCRYIMAYSPYHIDAPEKLRTSVLVLADEENTLARQHSYKFIAKLRGTLNDSVILLKNLPSAAENERYAYALAFLIKSLYKHDDE